MQLTQHDIEKLAAQARIALTVEEKKKFSEQLASILDYAAQIEEVDTSGVEIHSHVNYPTGGFRADIAAEPSASPDSIDQFPKKTGSLNQVKGVMQ